MSLSYKDKHQMLNVDACHNISRSRGVQVVRIPLLTIHKNIGFLSNTGPNSLEIHKTTKTAFDIMRQSACLVLNPITVYNYGFFFNCTPVGKASDSMTALHIFNRWVGA